MKATLKTLLALCLLAPATASALPPQLQAEDTDDDATVYLTVLDQAIKDDSRSFCQVRVVSVGQDVALTAGDRVRVLIYEDDFMGDDELWRTEFQVSAQEVAASRVDRSFDCPHALGSDLGDHAEVYARAEFDQEECGMWCLEDTPETGVLELSLVEDDASEQDDDSGSARAVPAGASGFFIGRDADWRRLNLVDPSLVTLGITYNTAFGRLDAVLFNPQGQQILQAVDNEAGLRFDTEVLPAGAYSVRITPRDGQDFSFYDLDLRIRTDACTPGAVQSAPCGRCGQSQRVCDDAGRWSDPSDCLNEGECQVGDTRSLPCGNCGQQVQSCSDQCAWQEAECTGQGVCQPGQEESEACAQGWHDRRCTDACVWSEYSLCGPRDCTADEERDCYDGPSGTAGVGMCVRGRQRCDNGAFSECVGQIMPQTEVCADSVDNDCDGKVDARDEDCGGGVKVGDACTTDADCGSLTCYKVEPYTGGYCTLLACDEECPEASDCGTVFGQRLCVKQCGRNADCRAGYLCADASMGGLACIPMCRNDLDCKDPAQPTCDFATALCVPASPDAALPEPDAGEAPDVSDPDAATPLRDSGTPTGDAGLIEASSEEDGGCYCGARPGATGGALPLVALGLLGLARRRRR